MAIIDLFVQQPYIMIGVTLYLIVTLVQIMNWTLRKLFKFAFAKSNRQESKYQKPYSAISFTGQVSDNSPAKIYVKTPERRLIK